VLDLSNAFHQLLLHPDDRYLTTFSTLSGVWEWNVMPQGICNAPSRLQRVMTEVLLGLKDSDAYMDDVVISTEALEGETMYQQMDRNADALRKTFARLMEYGFFLELDKCKLFQTEVEFCGHILTRGKRSAGKAKLAAIALWPTPTSLKGVRGFLGITGFYSCYVRNYAERALPLTNLLRGAAGTKINWNAASNISFRDLKTALAQEVPLQIVRGDRPFFLRVNTSGFAVGAILEQHSDEGELRPIAFYSRKLAKRQSAWAPREAEMYGIGMA